MTQTNTVHNYTTADSLAVISQNAAVLRFIFNFFLYIVNY